MKILTPENTNRLYFGLVFILFLGVASFTFVFTSATKSYISNMENQIEYVELGVGQVSGIDKKI
ncbi:MAG: hypothetical protein R3346_02270 [Candidatus Spechtbacterales bacterium]|nr:hypothetical protein [Candidatus Spechtbacterales bacterium]